MARTMVDYRDSPYKSEEQYGIVNSYNLGVTLRSLKEEIRSCKAANDKILQSQEKLLLTPNHGDWVNTCK